MLSRSIEILIPDPSVRDILAVSDWVYIMHQGKILQSGTAREIADSGFPVYMVEREPSIGGKMSQINKTFPTLDCAT